MFISMFISMFILYSFYVHSMFILCSFYVHFYVHSMFMFTLCSLHVHFMFIFNNISQHLFSAALFWPMSLCVTRIVFLVSAYIYRFRSAGERLLAVQLRPRSTLSVPGALICAQLSQFQLRSSALHSFGTACCVDGSRNYGQDWGAALRLVFPSLKKSMVIIIRSHESDGRYVAIVRDEVMVWLLSKVVRAIVLACLFWLAHADIRLVTVQVPVEFASALAFMYFNNTPLSRLPSEDSVKEHKRVDQ
jgi:hypothetical protein